MNDETGGLEGQWYTGDADLPGMVVAGCVGQLFYLQRREEAERVFFDLCLFDIHNTHYVRALAQVYSLQEQIVMAKSLGRLAGLLDRTCHP